MSTFYRLPQIGEPLMLVTHLVIREDAHVLYGFSSEAERSLFRALLKVSNVGARIGLAVLSGMTVEGFYRCVADKDLASLIRIPGVGRKTAERLLVELADRLPQLDVAVNGGGARLSATPEGEAQGALLALGYKPNEVVKMLANLDATRLTTEELIREALRRAQAG
jgi:holliday junction DNA helicase RuvA